MPPMPENDLTFYMHCRIVALFATNAIIDILFTAFLTFFIYSTPHRWHKKVQHQQFSAVLHFYRAKLLLKPDNLFFQTFHDLLFQS